MKNILITLLTFFTIFSTFSLELKATFDKALPKGISIAGKIVKENSNNVIVNNKNYVAGNITFTCNETSGGSLELELCTVGQPPTLLGGILYKKENKKLVRISTLCWLKSIPQESYKKITFNFPLGTFKKGIEYQIYLYRANQKGTLKFKSISLVTKAVGRSIVMNYKNTPDLVSPLIGKPSGKPDIHIQITGVNPNKSIKEIEVTRPGGRWVSGDDVKKNYWLVQYYDSADFPARKNPKNNFNGVLHTNLSCIDLVFECGHPRNTQFTCKVYYSDGTVDTWTSIEEKVIPPPLPIAFKKDILQLKQNFSLPSSFKQPVTTSRSFNSLISDKENLKENLIQRGLAHRRLWSLGWFLPFAGHNRKPSKAVVEKYCTFAYQVALREIQLFNKDGKNIANKAKVTGNCSSPWVNIKNVIDNNCSLDSSAKSASPSYNQVQKGSITLTFDKEISLSKAVLFHGTRNGNAPGFVARDFSIEVLSNNKWQNIAKIIDNTKDKTEHQLKNIVAKAVKINIDRSNKLLDYGKFDWSFNNSYLNILEKSKTVPKDSTFHYWYLGHDSTIHFALPKDNYQPKVLKEYQKWRKEHPNFMGFQVVEFDNDFRHTLGWGANRDQMGAIGSYNYASKNFVVHRQLPKLPNTRLEALAQYEKIYKFYNQMMFFDCANFSSVTMWHHQPMAWGAPSTVLESFGGGCPNLPMQISAARGAARQFGNKPWGCYFATYLGNGYLNYLKKGTVFGPDCGKSVSLYRRQNYFVYLTGSSYVDFEHPDLAFLTKKQVKNTEPVLSPHGKAVLECANFARNDKERGNVYTPIALLLDFAHGWDVHESRKIWYGMFKPNQQDRNIDVWMKGIFGFTPLPQEGYGCNMSQTGFAGFTDILVANPPNSTVANLNDYKAAIIAGNIAWNNRVVKSIKDYVNKGGILVINCQQLPKELKNNFTGVEFTNKEFKDTTIVTFDNVKLASSKEAYQAKEVKLKSAKVLLKNKVNKPLATINNYGKGKVILTLQKYLIEEPSNAGTKEGLSTIHYILSLLRSHLLPVKITGDSPCDIVVSKLSKGWRISLFNNRGVYKQPLTAAIVNSKEKTTQKITFDSAFCNAVEKISNKKLVIKKLNNSSSVEVVIQPGNLAVIDIIR